MRPEQPVSVQFKVLRAAALTELGINTPVRTSPSLATLVTRLVGLGPRPVHAGAADPAKQLHADHHESNMSHTEADPFLGAFNPGSI